jgi:DNA modification methylase
LLLRPLIDFGLRDYGTAKWEGGDPGCDHIKSKKPPTLQSSSGLGIPADGGPRRIGENNTYHEAYTEPFRDVCGKCGATRVDRQIGLEATPAEYVATMVRVFEEVRRVLRKDGVCFLNLGDSYAGSWGAQSRPDTTDTGRQGGGSMLSARQIAAHPRLSGGTGSLKNTPGLKPKDLIGVPWRVAFALQEAGWWLRSDVVWAKPNPMPESVTDRPTRSHEYLFLLAKSERYYYDADAILEPLQTAPHAPGNKKLDAGRNDHDQMTKVWGNPKGKNRRSVWSISPKPYRGAHFAVFPPALVEPCVLAGCPVGGVVLDPFSGSGTTGLVALRHDRRYVGLELNESYCAMSRSRIESDCPMFNTDWTQEAAG